MVLFCRDQCIDQTDLRPYSALVFGDQNLRLVLGFASKHLVLAAPGVKNGLQQRDVFWWYGGREMLHRYPSQGRQHQIASIVSCDLQRYNFSLILRLWKYSEK